MAVAKLPANAGAAGLLALRNRLTAQAVDLVGD